MPKRFSQFLDYLSDFLAARKGLIPIIGILLIILNFAMQILSIKGFLVETNSLFHLGVIVAILGLMLARAL